MNANYDLLMEPQKLNKMRVLENSESYISTRQDIWSVITIFWLLLSPLIGYLAGTVWKLRGSIVIAWGIAIIALISSLLKISHLKLSRYFLFASIYYLAIILIPALSGSNFRVKFNNEALLCIFLLIAANSYISAKVYNQALKWMAALIVVSLVVIIIQQFYNPLFLVSKNVSEEFEWDKFSNFQYRLHSIWSYVSDTASGFSLMAPYAVLLGYMIEKKKNGWWIALLCAAVLLYSVLTRQRYLIIVYLIITFQIYRLLNRAVNQIAVLVVLFLCIGLLLYSGFPLFDLIQYRYLDVQAGGIAYGSFSARTQSWEAFKRFFSSSWLLGIDMSKQASDYYNYLGRETGQNLLGIIYPFITYGIIGSIWYYLLLYFLLRDSYIIGRKTKNYGFFVLFIAFIATGFANGSPLSDGGIMLAIMFMKYYRDNIPARQPQIQVQI